MSHNGNRVEWSTVTIEELSEMTWIQKEDIETTLSSLGLLKYCKG